MKTNTSASTPHRINPIIKICIAILILFGFMGSILSIALAYHTIFGVIPGKGTVVSVTDKISLGKFRPPPLQDVVVVIAEPSQYAGKYITDADQLYGIKDVGKQVDLIIDKRQYESDLFPDEIEGSIGNYNWRFLHKSMALFYVFIGIVSIYGIKALRKKNLLARSTN